MRTGRTLPSPELRGCDYSPYCLVALTLTFSKLEVICMAPELINYPVSIAY